MRGNDSELSTLLNFVLIGAGIYLASRLFRLGESVVDTTSQFISDALIKLTLPEPVNVQGYAILPNGDLVSMNALAVKKTPDAEFFYFDLNGMRYQLGPRTTQGNYPTRRVT